MMEVGIRFGPFSGGEVAFILRVFLVLLAALLAAPLQADVAVLANRTLSSITVELVGAGGIAKDLTIASGDSQPVTFQRSMQVRFGEFLGREQYTLQPGSAYFFTRGADETQLQLEQIGLGENSLPRDPATPPKFSLRPPDVATITVKLLADDDEPTHRRIWEPKLRERVAKASDILERHAGVRLQVVEVGTWNSDERQRNFTRTLREFELEVKPEPAQLVIGFSSQYQVSRGRSHLGVTRWPLHSHILLRERSRDLLESERVELLVHELGHYLGASHSPEPQSVMRPILTRGLQRSVGSRIQFDPVNALIIAMIGEEVRLHGVRSVSQLSKPTITRLKEIYGVLAKAMPHDPAARQYLVILEQMANRIAQVDNKPQPRRRPQTQSALARETNRILSHLVEAAARRGPANDTADNAADDIAADGDELTNFYVRQAAQAASRQRSSNAKRAMLLALGIFIDDADFLQKFPLTASFAKQVESAERRDARLQVLGQPTMRERTDLTKHFFVSAHLLVAGGKPAAVAAGLAKETRDSNGGTGFSFIDMAANRAGIVFAEQLLADRIKLQDVAERFHVDDYLPTLRGLEEGLTATQLEEQYGGEGQPTIADTLAEIEDRILSLPAYDQVPRD